MPGGCSIFIVADLVINLCTTLCEWYCQALRCIPLSLHMSCGIFIGNLCMAKCERISATSVLLLRMYYFVTSVLSVCVRMSVSLFLLHGWCDAQLDIIHSYPSALMPSVTKSNSYPPASNQLQSYSSWPTDAQLASAVPDFMRQASATAQFVHWKTSRCWVLGIF